MGRSLNWSAAGRPTFAGILGAAFFTVLQFLSLDRAQAAGPFDGMQGSWSGSGSISNKDGTKERMACQVQYLVVDGGTNLQQSLRCSSPSYQFHVNAFVKANGGSLSGNWSETTNNVSGSIGGNVSGRRITINVNGGNAFSASMIIVTNGSRQSVTITPKGTSVVGVSVTVAKS